jgi:hypothetical protein
MDHGQLRMIADTCQWVFSEALLNACGKAVRFCRRQRVLTPLRLGLALTATCASQRLATIAAVPCSCPALFGTTVTYKAFSNQGAKPHFADFARTMPERRSSDLPLKVLGFKKGRAFAECRRLSMQDGSAFALHDGWREVWPGRFTVVKPAAVALQTTMDLRCAAPTTVVWTPDPARAPAFWPAPPTRQERVRLAERGSVD